MSPSEPYIEVRGEFDREHVDVLDAVAQARPGQSRTSILREILADWVAAKKHEASLIHRVTRDHGNAPAPDRHRAGKGVA